MAQPTASPRSASSSTRTFHPTDYLRVVYKRRWAAIPAFLLVFVSGALGSVRTVPIYEATTQIMIEKDARRATTLDNVLQERDSWYEDDFYTTQYRMLRSRALAVRTAKALETGAPPENVPPPSGLSFSLSGITSVAYNAIASVFRSTPPPAPAADETVAGDESVGATSPALAAKAGRILGGVGVAPVRNSRLVDLTFRSPDPVFAAAALNELVNQYAQQSLEFRLEATGQTNAFLNAQLEEQRKAVEESERKLQEYKEQNDAGSVDDTQNIVVQKLNALNAELTQARIARVDKEVTYNTLLDMQKRGDPLDTFPLVQASQIVQRLKQDIATKESSRASMSTQFGPAYQPMRDLIREIETARRDLDAEIQKIVAGARAEFESARTKEQTLQQSLNAQQGESLGLDRKMMQYAALEREAQGNRQLYQNLLTRTKETGAVSDYRGLNVQVIDKAEKPQTPVLPQTQRDLLTAAFGGLLLAVALAFGIEYFDSRIKSPEEIAQHLNLPFLGLIPAVTMKDQSGEAPLLGDAPPAFSEAMRSVRTALLFSSADEGARSVMVTSTGPHEGKTLVSSSLAITLAQAGQRTLVVDADMRRPRMHEALGRAQEPGLSNLLVGEATLPDAARPTSVPNLFLLAAGHIPPNPAELLGSKRFLDLLEDLKRRFDWVVIDAPPVMPVTDAAVIASHMGGVLFVIGSEMTPRQSASVAVDQLRGVNAKFVGAVLNRVNLHRHSYYYAPYHRKSYAKYYQRSAKI